MVHNHVGYDTFSTSCDTVWEGSVHVAKYNPTLMLERPVPQSKYNLMSSDVFTIFNKTVVSIYHTHHEKGQQLFEELNEWNV